MTLPDGPAARRWVLWLIAGLTLGRVGYALVLGIAPQEAYYWQYARHLDLSYFDHPPAVGWSIAAGRTLFGDTPIGIRLPALVGGAVLSWLVFSLGERLFSARVGLVAVVVANATVLFAIGAVVITPDTPLLVFWAAAMRVGCELVLPDGAGGGRFGWRWLLLGLCCGGALLSKYTALLLPVQLFVLLLTSKEGRRALRTPPPWIGVGVMVLVFTPVLAWNYGNDFASFAFQTTRRAGEVHGFRFGLVWRYFALQAVAVTPLLYGALWWASWQSWKRRTEPSLGYLAFMTLPGLLLFTLVSPFHWVKMSWVAPQYVGLLVVLAALWVEHRAARRFALVATAFGALVTLGAYLMPVVPAIPFPAEDDLTSGWAQLARAVDAERKGDELVVGWDYKTASELAYHLPGQPETAGANLFGGEGLQYAYWFDRDSARGRDLLIVANRRRRFRDADSKLAAHCARWERLPPVEVHRGTRVVATFERWRCEGYR